MNRCRVLMTNFRGSEASAHRQSGLARLTMVNRQDRHRARIGVDPVVALPTLRKPINRLPQVSLMVNARASRSFHFRNVGNDKETDFYQFSLADAVITELARVRSLVVRPSSVIVKYQNKQVDPAEAGQELSVDAILTATFLRAGDRLRVTAQLLDVLTSRDSLERTN